MNIQSVRKPINDALKAKGFAIVKNAAVIDADDVRLLIRVDRGPASGAFYLDFGIWIDAVSPSEQRAHRQFQCHIYGRMDDVIPVSEGFWSAFSNGSVDENSDEFVGFVDRALAFGRRNSELDEICENFVDGVYESCLVLPVARHFLEGQCP